VITDLAGRLPELLDGLGVSLSLIGPGLVGSPATVADRLEEIAEAVGGDGFLFHAPGMRVSRKYVIEVTDGLVPELRRRGLLREGRTSRRLRDTLREF
jgi:alkanesulfonate monooxygenase SsuD/methylene tetrahydromethanopterin reductase-like flavin-dependent oxidoreductase (luciferase family)